MSISEEKNKNSSSNEQLEINSKSTSGEITSKTSRSNFEDDFLYQKTPNPQSPTVNFIT